MRRSTYLIGVRALCAGMVSIVLLGLPPTPAVATTGGTELWASRYWHNGSDEPVALAADPHGAAVFTTGSSWGSDTSRVDYATLAFDATSGSRLWSARYNSGPGAIDAATSVAVSPDASLVFVTGNGGGAFATLAYDARSGARRWIARYTGPSGSTGGAEALAVSPDGSRLFVTGMTYGSTSADYGTVAYDAATGTQLWSARYDDRWHDYDGPTSLAASPDGSTLFVTGWAAGVNADGIRSGDYLTVAYDASTGSRRWAARYDGSGGTDRPAAIVAGTGGAKVFVTGESEGIGTSADYATIAYDAATGGRIWVRRYNGSAGAQIDSATALAMSADGSRIFVTGYSEGVATGYDYATLAYNAATGRNVWTARYDGVAHGSDVAAAIGVDPAGSKVFVTGSSEGDIGDIRETMAYDARTGAVSWLARNDPSQFRSSALAVAPEGGLIFVARRAWNASSDYLIAAYVT